MDIFKWFILDLDNKIKYILEFDWYFKRSLLFLIVVNFYVVIDV